MLVFALNANEHIFTNLQKGVSRIGVTPRWLLETVDEINHYLPNDWRMTRRINRFAIKIIGEDPKNHPMLVGHIYRNKSNTMDVLHIIDTVFPKDFALKETDEDDRKTPLRHPHERYTPNLYYFKKCPEGFKSPLFARQYEKVLISKKKITNCKFCKDTYYEFEYLPLEYHWIHPLTKEGLDLHHFLWIKYDFSNKTVEIVSTTNNNYHGKDFWIVPYLEDDAIRSNKFNDYIRNYESFFKRFNVSPVNVKLSHPTYYEVEFKLLLSKDRFNEIEGFLLEKIKGIGISLLQILNPEKAHLDTYLDDHAFSLFKQGVSFKIMEHRENLRVTFKKRLAVADNLKEGLHERIEEESSITKSQKDKLINGKPLNNLPYRLINYFVPKCMELSPKLQVEILRRVLVIEDKGHQKAEIAFDKVIYKADGLKEKFFYEIEIEGRGMYYEHIQRIFNLIKDNFPVQPSFHTKYERGVLLIKRAKNEV
ncbi:MAG: hypothetical protein N2738_05245 [Thermodesulfovibrionales bacterium]|nr:hypothetical protein [Thermodesulfovibrionales bacterium]